MTTTEANADRVGAETRKQRLRWLADVHRQQTGDWMMSLKQQHRPADGLVTTKSVDEDRCMPAPSTACRRPGPAAIRGRPIGSSQSTGAPAVMSTADQLRVRAVGLVAALTEAGFKMDIRDGHALFAYP